MKGFQEMTNAPTSTRRFSPIFVATITPAAVETRQGAKGPYTVMPGATISKSGRADRQLTVMAFGKQRDEVEHMLTQGRPVDLAVQHDGGTLKIIGLPRAKTA